MTKPTHPVELICAAIYTQEGGWEKGTVPAVRNNPGDLDFAGQIGATNVGWGPDPDIADFDTLRAGTAALFRQVWLQVAEGQTVRQIVNQWAPASAGNDSKVYLANILEWTGLPADTPVLQLIPPLQKLN